MQLLYVWTKSDSLVVKGEGVHFHSEYRFEYLPEQGELYVKRNPFFIEHFFSENTGFDQVTAIVGRNGTGKTSLLRFMIALLANGNEGFAAKILEEPILCVFRIFGHDELIVVHNPDLKLVGGNYEENHISVFEPDYFRRSYIVKDSEAFFNNLSVVLYSNIFDHSAIKNGNRLIDMTTNTLLSKSIHNDPQAHETLAHKYNDIRMQIDFFLEQGNSSFWTIPFEVPKEMYFRFSRLLQRLEENLRLDIINFGSGINEEQSSFEGYLYKAYNKMEKYDIYNGIQKDISVEGIKSFTMVFLLLLYEVYRESPHTCTEKINRFIDEYELDPENDIGYEIFSNFVGLLTERLPREDDNRRFLEKAEVLEIVYDELIELIMDNVIFMEDGAIRAQLVSNESPASTVLSILRKGNQKVSIDFDLDWPDLSSGEKSLLTMYARLYESFSLNIEQEHILLMIDEGELYMHPQWQRRFIKELIDFSTEYCCVQQQKTLDIVLTTNSPFLISDLPHANIVFLQATENGATVVGGLEDHRQSFAANIHTLLSDAFFLPDGLLGEFAKQKINRLVHELYQDDIADIREKESRIRKQIEIIGEPVIRNKLISVLEDRLRIQDQSFQQLVNRISDLEAEVRSLKGKQ
ncbi:AAA family ATPase [Paenibacillus sp. FSL W8-0186]|uniref:Endonuclease GajA/Old nuclease/RecF-like AAA domain-containing protein n=1 Tax=Paenibacillus woosongensis TaxID=307580 RepID=A0ABQ4MUD2_9BACL|nr:AAA family ATPase [Paenibacillus woosongensis]GIP59523.1 hypothetical protein J15TS10_33370 [Paenibacillus woosongensis]